MDIKKIFFFFFIHSLLIYSQVKLKSDREAIMNMCGCFEIEFNFTETFQHSKDKNYKPSKDYSSKALELAIPIINEKRFISIQHLLIVGSDDEKYIIKHWRQDWEYQNQNFYHYNSDNNWVFSNKEKKEVKNQWTQKVFQVDDSPRYQGSATWVHVDGKSYWENTTNAPLPRREFTKRSDYNLMERTNRHEITDYGWVHIQDNKKIKIKSDNIELLAEEKGFSPYRRVDIEKCNAAVLWWREKEKKWSSVRNIWNDIYASKQNLSLKKEYDGKKLYEYLLFSDEFNETDKHLKLINNFLIN